MNAVPPQQTAPADDPTPTSDPGSSTAAGPPGVGGPRRRPGNAEGPRGLGRTKLAPAEKLKVWVRAGGLCVLCKKYLLDGALTGLPVSLGELAHIVGQQDNDDSPRGRHPLPRADRDLAENVLLACESCHEEIDDQLVTGILDVDRLTAIKAAHEQHIRHVTTLPDDQRSLVLRVVGKLRGNPLEVTRTTAAATVVGAGHFPWFDLDRDRLGVEVDLRALPGEAAADTGPYGSYYATARAAIDEIVDTRLHDAIKAGDVRHISVFAFARLPLLVYLGGKLEDNVAVEVYQRHRDTQNWAWNPAAPTPQFTVTTTGPLAGASEVVLIWHVSGTVNTAQLPDDLRDLPVLAITPDMLPSPDVLRSRAALTAFTAAVREVNATLDAHTTIGRVHLLGALPPAAAVEIGRLHDPHIHPRLVVYSRRDDGSYVPALEIP